MGRPPLGLGFVPVPAPTAETAYLDGEAVVYEVEAHRSVLLNPTGSAVWMLLDGESSLAEVAEAISEIFGVPVEDVAPEVQDVATRFGELGLLDGIDPLEGVLDEHGQALVFGGALPVPPVP